MRKIIPFVFVSAIIISSKVFSSDTVKVDMKGGLKGSHVSNVAIEGKRTIFLRGPIDKASWESFLFDITVLSVDTKQKLYNIVIESPGGRSDYGMSMITVLQRKKFEGKVFNCYIDTYAASMAAIIQSFCSKSFINSQGFLMYHQGTVTVPLREQEMESVVKFLADSSIAFNNLLANQLGISRKTYEDFIKVDQWMASNEAVSKGFVDGSFDFLRIVDLDGVSTKSIRPLEYQ